MVIRRLAAGDEDVLDRFLVRHADASMFLRSNARSLGLTDRGDPLQGSYVAAFDGAGRVTGAAAHYGNQMVVLQAPGAGAAAALAASAASESGRPVAGFIGPLDQVMAARDGLGMAARPTALASEEDLFALDIDRMQVPPPIADGRLECRAPAGGAEIEQARAWRASYEVEALGARPGAELDDSAARDIEASAARGDLWVLVDRRGGERGAMLSMTATTARMPDAVTIGGVYTPPELRGRGMGRAVVAGQLLGERRGGVRRAVLFTGRNNAAARRAYVSLGFRVVGDYALILFAA
ncbi:MAG TPA: GNAT family N-acetyltransferase [Kofleriaceae bacterium]|nr:GNAT family N-acetyltransferase [Kofleriaceae bacterium]